MHVDEDLASETSRSRAAHQPVGDHRGRAAHPQADARIHDRRALQHVSRHGLRLRRAARLAGGRSLREHRLAAVVADQLQPADRPRVRAADDVERDHGRRSIGVDALRRRRRRRRRSRHADRDADRARHRHGRHVGGVLPGFDRADHVRRRLPRARRGAAAHRQGPGHSLPRGLPARLRPAGHQERRQPERDADRVSRARPR